MEGTQAARPCVLVTMPVSMSALAALLVLSLGKAVLHVGMLKAVWVCTLLGAVCLTSALCIHEHQVQVHMPTVAACECAAGHAPGQQAAVSSSTHRH